MIQNSSVPLWCFFLLIGLAIFFSIQGFDPQGGNSTKEKKPYASTAFVREPANEAVFKRNGFKFNCNSCHRNFETKDFKTRKTGLIGEHTDLVLKHGDNDRCVNCHHPKNREAFVDHDGSEIPYQKSVDLCKKCHGPKYRDWKHGVHGRSNGYWDQSKGESLKTGCISCHDPHFPKFKAMKPFPGPFQKNDKNKEKH